jgi:hypothetical protein
MWGCNKLHLPEEGQKLMQCQKCKEVYYCSALHQVRFACFVLIALLKLTRPEQRIDWQQHRDVCEARRKKAV